MNCPHFSQCGGCYTLDMPYDEQLRVKEKSLRAFYPDLLPIIGVKSAFRYRNKMEFSFSQDKAKNHYLGLYMKRGRIVDLCTCLLTPEWFVDALERTRTWWKSTALLAYHPHKDTGSLRTLTLREGRRTGEKMALLTVSGRPEFALTKQHLADFVKPLLRIDPNMSIFLRIQQAIKGRPTRFFEYNLNGPDVIHEELTVGGRTLRFAISPSSFFQPNTEGAELIYNQALALLPPSNTLYDLYCGTGSLGIACSPRVDAVLGIELSPYAVYDARANCALNNIQNVTVQQGDVGALLSDLPTPDAAIVDPPRTGLGPVALAHILRLRPKHLLYISCNPKTLAADLSALTPAYTLEALRPIDQFPHTPHVEVVSILSL